MNKHTPAPWLIDDTEDGRGDPAIDILGPKRTMDVPVLGKRLMHPVLATISSSWAESKQEFLANARLIAAAPELLRLLKEIILVDSHKGGDHSDLLYEDPEFRKEIEIAIAKAEGKE